MSTGRCRRRTLRCSVLALTALVSLAAASCAEPDAISAGAGAAPTSTLLIDRLIAPVRTEPDPSGATALSVPPKPSLGCGGASAPGSDRIDFTSGGLARFALRHRPQDYDGTRPAPLLVDLHAYTESAAVHAVFDGLAATADRHAFLLVTPAGSGDPPIWNATRSPLVTDDVGFIAELLHRVEATDCVDTNRVYVTGFSNGALMASLLACDLSTQIAAVAPVAGVASPTDCPTTRPIPIVAFHGTADRILAYGGGTGRDGDRLMNTPSSVAVFKGLNQTSVPDAMAEWARRGACGGPMPDERIGADVVVHRWNGCRADVELYTVEGGGHSWPGSLKYRAAPGIGTTTLTVDANEVMWDFFRRHPLTGG